MEYDVIIVGGGPAGSAAAYTLCKYGIKPLLIDKSIFPRDKLCGGMFTIRAKKLYKEIFAENFSSVLYHKSFGCEIYYKKYLLNNVRHYRELYFINRDEFDDFLLKLAKEKGTTLLEGNKVKSIDKNRNELTLTNGKIYKAKYIIGADGIHSVVAKSIYKKSFNKSSCALCLSVDIDKDPYRENPKFYFGVTDWGIGWSFPKKDRITIGLSARLSKNENLKDIFKLFLKQLGYSEKDYKIQGQFAPFGDYKKNPGYKNILLCGDAAGYLDPVSGEGIAYALESGYHAALTIIDCYKEGGSNLLSNYKTRNKNITKNLDYANLLKFILFSKNGEKLLIDNLKVSNSLILLGLDLLSDEIEYSKFFKYISKEYATNTISRFF